MQFLRHLRYSGLHQITNNGILGILKGNILSLGFFFLVNGKANNYQMQVSHYPSLIFVIRYQCGAALLFTRATRTLYLLLP